MSLADLSPLANHLWQSTVFVAVAGLLAFSVKKNAARIRYWLWLAASLKFLIPFAALVTIGRQFGRQSATGTIQPDVTFLIDTIGQPFARSALAGISSPATASPLVVTLPTLLLAAWVCGCAMHLLAWWVRWRRVAILVREAAPLEHGRALNTLRRLEGLVGRGKPLGVVTSDTSLEPGVFGILNPMLVWPRSIGDRLTDSQIEAILAHELCHVRRRDNLTASLHMLVEATFWFHPLVWWIEKRLVEERERACDEEVVQLGCEPQVYAESILKTCEFYVGSPLSCVAGVTGSDLKKRIEAIMRNHSGAALTAWKKLLLATAGVVAIVTPLAVGALNTPRLQAQSPPFAANRLAFEVASIKQNIAGLSPVGHLTVQPGGRLLATNQTARSLIQFAFSVSEPQLLDAPEWTRNLRFDVNAKAASPDASVADLRRMLQTLLETRFRLVLVAEEREMNVQAIVRNRDDGKLGGRLVEVSSQAECAAGLASLPKVERPAGAVAAMVWQCGSPDQILPEMVYKQLREIAVDRTELTGTWLASLVFKPEGVSNTRNSVMDDNVPTFSTALQEQLGLKLTRVRSTIPILSVKSIEMPTDD